MRKKTLTRREQGRAAILAGRPLRALVTGASSGIGREMCELLAEKRHDLVLVARRREQLEQAAMELEAAHGVTCTVIAADLGRAGDAARLSDELGDLEIDVLVNNAGFMMDGHMLSFEWEQHEAYQRLMAISPAELTYRFLPGMIGRHFGQVINVASAAALMPATPFNTFYGPCKHHMTVLTRSLQAEYGPAGVTFTVCFPPPVAGTGIVDDSAHGEAWRRFEFLLATKRHTAEATYAAAQAGRMTVPIGLSGFIAVGSRLLPTNTFARLVGGTVAFLSKEKAVESLDQEQR